MNNKNFYLVSSHLDSDFFTTVTEDKFQEEVIESVCDQCGDSDRILKKFDDYNKAKKYIYNHYRNNPDYRKEMLEKAKEAWDIK